MQIEAIRLATAIGWYLLDVSIVNLKLGGIRGRTLLALFNDSLLHMAYLALATEIFGIIHYLLTLQSRSQLTA